MARTPLAAFFNSPIQKVSLKGMLGPNQSRDGSFRTKHSADISKKEKLP
jgi:hypothetical protein